MVSIDVYALALLTAVLWGFSPILEKRGLAGGGNPLQASVVVVAIDSVLYWLLLLALQGPGNIMADISPTTIVLFAVAGLIGTSIGRLSTFHGVNRVGASVSGAVMSTRPVFATVIAVAFIGEQVTASLAAGIFVLFVGLVVLALSKGGDITGWRLRDLVFPLGAGAAFAIGNVLRRFGLTTTPATALEAVAINETAALIALLAYVLVRSRSSLSTPTRTSYGLFAVSGVLTGIALLSLFEALARGPVSVVDPLYGSSPLFTAVFAFLLLGDLERVTRRVWIGAIIVVAGVVLITAI